MEENKNVEFKDDREETVIAEEAVNEETVENTEPASCEQPATCEQTPPSEENTSCEESTPCSEDVDSVCEAPCTDSENADTSETEVSADNKEETPEDKKKKFWKEVLGWVECIVAAVLIALFVNNVIIANSTVPTSSMESTIMTNDRVIGTRLSYSVFGEPKRGDVAIFKFGWICEHCKKARGEKTAPDVCPLCGKTITRPQTMYYVKRIIGEPGDVITFKVNDHVRVGDLHEIPDQLKGREDTQYYTAAVYVNGEKLEEDYLLDPILYTGDLKFEVPEGCYFFLGDNRNNSNDSRFWDNPYIEKKDVIAKVQFKYYPGFKKIK